MQQLPATDVDAPELLLDDQLCFALYSATHAISRRYKPHLDQLGITYPQFLCLLVLWENDRLTVRAIGDRLQLDSGTLTPLLKRLEAAGLVERAKDAHDGRLVRILLTPDGRNLRDRARRIPPAIGCATGRTNEQIARLTEDLLRLRRALCTAA